MTNDKQPAAHADHPGRHLEMVGRWYMVNKMGMATLCANKADAQQEAADAQRFWPHMGPHRAMQLVEAETLASAIGTRRVLCDLLGECLPIIDAMLQLPGDDGSDARLYGLISRIQAAQAAVAEEALEGCRA